ncbi:MAG: hypothetical protein Ct9H90mP6_00630 [Gammaproteobacteria bacterium]|nr:MAG: hypothetical protein Ct9H90mP6_00630 [Gammaproteobacteria bacterium]
MKEKKGCLIYYAKLVFKKIEIGFPAAHKLILISQDI